MCLCLEFLHKQQNHNQLLSWACLHYHICLVYGHEEGLTSATQQHKLMQPSCLTQVFAHRIGHVEVISTST